MTVFNSTKRSRTQDYGKKGVSGGWMYTITKSKETNEGMRIYWRCETRSCHASIKTNLNYEIIRKNEDHNHNKPDPETLKAEIARSNMMQQAAVSVSY